MVCGIPHLDYYSLPQVAPGEIYVGRYEELLYGEDCQALEHAAQAGGGVPSLELFKRLADVVLR